MAAPRRSSPGWAEGRLSCHLWLLVQPVLSRVWLPLGAVGGVLCGGWALGCAAGCLAPVRGSRALGFCCPGWHARHALKPWDTLVGAGPLTPEHLYNIWWLDGSVGSDDH